MLRSSAALSFGSGRAAAAGGAAFFAGAGGAVVGAVVQVTAGGLGWVVFGHPRIVALREAGTAAGIPPYMDQFMSCTICAMAVIFDELKSSSDPALANAARLAAERYGQRCAYVQSRIRAYTGETISVRLKEFLRLPELHASGFAVVPRLSSRLKDFVLGVLGIGRIGPQRNTGV